MKTIVEFPDEIADELRQRAIRDGRELVAEIVELVRLGILASDLSRDELAQVLEHYRARKKSSHPSAPLRASGPTIDPSTGLPAIYSPSEAAIHFMGIDEILALGQEALSEDEFERAGLSVRH